MLSWLIPSIFATASPLQSYSSKTGQSPTSTSAQRYPPDIHPSPSLKRKQVKKQTKTNTNSCHQCLPKTRYTGSNRLRRFSTWPLLTQTSFASQSPLSLGFHYLSCHCFTPESRTYTVGSCLSSCRVPLSEALLAWLYLFFKVALNTNLSKDSLLTFWGRTAVPLCAHGTSPRAAWQASSLEKGILQRSKAWRAPAHICAEFLPTCPSRLRAKAITSGAVLCTSYTLIHYMITTLTLMQVFLL